MSPMKKRMLTGLLLAFAVSGAAWAQDKSVIDLNHSFAEQRRTVMADLEGDKYREISLEQKSAVVAALNRIQSRLGSADDASRLHENDRVAVMNDQSQINVILTQAAADSRLVCRREKTIGSNMPQNNCLTVAERERLRLRAQDDTIRAHQRIGQSQK